MSDPECPGCGAREGDLILLSQSLGAPPMRGYRCAQCGLGFTFSEPPDPPPASPEEPPTDG